MANESQGQSVAPELSRPIWPTHRVISELRRCQQRLREYFIVSPAVGIRCLPDSQPPSLYLGDDCLTEIGEAELKQVLERFGSLLNRVHVKLRIEDDRKVPYISFPAPIECLLSKSKQAIDPAIHAFLAIYSEVPWAGDMEDIEHERDDVVISNATIAAEQAIDAIVMQLEHQAPNDESPGHLDAEFGEVPGPTKSVEPPTAGESSTKKPGRCNDQMAGMIVSKPESMGWSSTQWSKHLGFARSTIVDTPTWKKLKSARLQDLAERKKDRRHKSKKGDSYDS